MYATSYETTTELKCTVTSASGAYFRGASGRLPKSVQNMVSVYVTKKCDNGWGLWRAVKQGRRRALLRMTQFMNGS